MLNKNVKKYVVQHIPEIIHTFAKDKIVFFNEN
jgi:hypothetical protein